MRLRLHLGKIFHNPTIRAACRVIHARIPNMYQLSYESPYEKGSMIFDNINTASFWFNQFYLAGNVKIIMRKMCKRHSEIGCSDKFGKCCKIVAEA